MAHTRAARTAWSIAGMSQLPVNPEGGRRLVAAMDHAVLAARVFPVAVFLPRRVLDQTRERLMVRVRHQVARSLPTPRVVRRIAPRRASQLAGPFQKFEIDRRTVELEFA